MSEMKTINFMKMKTATTIFSSLLIVISLASFVMNGGMSLRFRMSMSGGSYKPPPVVH